jgi:hypothetical protein
MNFKDTVVSAACGECKTLVFRAVGLDQEHDAYALQSDQMLTMMRYLRCDPLVDQCLNF